MRMTIDLSIEELESTKDYPASDSASDEALDFAIEIMHKYKKITEIVMNGDDTHYKLLMQIKEVLEDGDEH